MSDRRAPLQLSTTDDYPNTSMEDMQAIELGGRDVLALGLQKCSATAEAGRIGLELVDISDPASPQHLSLFETAIGVHEFDMQDGTAYYLRSEERDTRPSTIFSLDIESGIARQRIAAIKYYPGFIAEQVIAGNALFIATTETCGEYCIPTTRIARYPLDGDGTGMLLDEASDYLVALKAAPPYVSWSRLGCTFHLYDLNSGTIDLIEHDYGFCSDLLHSGNLAAWTSGAEANREIFVADLDSQRQELVAPGWLRGFSDERTIVYRHNSGVYALTL